MLPLLVLLPGMDGTGILFEPLLRALPPSVHTLIVSYPSNQRLSYTQLAELVRPTLPTDRPFLLLAESFSGPVAAYLADGPLTNLQGLVFVSSFLASPHPQWLWVTKWLPMRLLFSLPIPAVMLRQYCLGTTASNELIALFRHAITQVKADTLAERLTLLRKLPYPLHSKPNYLPTLYIRAKSDKLVPEWNALAVQRLFPKLNIHDVEGPHFILQANPIGCCQPIFEFMHNVMENKENLL